MAALGSTFSVDVGQLDCIDCLGLIYTMLLVGIFICFVHYKDISIDLNQYHSHFTKTYIYLYYSLNKQII